VPGIVLPVEVPWAKSVYWVYGVVPEEGTGMTNEQFAQRLFEQGVETRPFFLGIHEQPVFHKMGLFINKINSIAERLAREGFYLPTGLTIQETEIDNGCDAVRKALR
jgi:perosamine synthetase